MSDPRIVVVPWYEPEDFLRLRQMRGGVELPSSYDNWRDEALAHAKQLTASGAVAQIVRLNIESYFKWLGDQGTADTVKARLDYLHVLSSQAGSEAWDMCSHEPPIQQ